MSVFHKWARDVVEIVPSRHVLRRVLHIVGESPFLVLIHIGAAANGSERSWQYDVLFLTSLSL